MPIIEITSLDHPGIAAFATMTEAQLRNRIEPELGIFIAESPKVIRVALDASLIPTAILCERRHITGDAADIIARCPDTPVYIGVLCAMRRPALPDISAVCRDASRIAVIDGVTDTTNIGAIFRSAAALGIDGVALTRDSCDPLNRRAVRVSMGTVFLIPWTWVDDAVNDLRDQGFRTAAMALSDDSVRIDDPALKAERRLAIILGTEGDGLPRTVISQADYVARIPMSHGTDSLNVAAASAVAFWELRRKQK